MRTHTRRGLTLIELLVVIMIITALATLIIAVGPKFGERQRASRGASMLQSWLNLAKQRALRDGRPVGIRLPVVPGASTNPSPVYQFASSYVREVSYVEVPDENIGGTVTVPFPSTGTPDYRYIGLTTSVQFTPVSAAALIQAGDVFVFLDKPLAAYAPRRVAPTNPQGPDDSVALVSTNSTVNPPQYTYRIRLDQPLPPAPFTTQSYQVSRRARPLVGEPVLQLPQDIAIDISRQYDPNNPNALPTWYRLFPPTSNTGGGYPFDILFSPSGQVIGAEGNLGSRLCLWVRDVSINTPSAAYGNDPTISDPTQLPPGDNTLITVFTRTGQVASHPIDPSGLVPNATPTSNTWNPFRFTQDGLSSGQ